jgi:hypothetical protein
MGRPPGGGRSALYSKWFKEDQCEVPGFERNGNVSPHSLAKPVAQRPGGKKLASLGQVVFAVFLGALVGFLLAAMSN